MAEAIHPVLDFLLYHSITLVIVLFVILVTYIHHRGSLTNAQLAQSTANTLTPFLQQTFTNYSQEFVV